MEELYNQHTSGWAKGKFTWYKDQGFWNNPMAPEGVTWAQENFKARPNDVLLCSCPKSGITWLKALSFAIVIRKTLGKSTNPLLTNLPHVCVPFIDKDTQRLKETLKNSNFPLLATHIPYASLPESVIASNCKIVYIYRNVKDVIVSDYHFLNKIHHIPEEDASFEERFDEFYQGISHYGPYWDHILGYWKAMLERPNRILFLKYEDMKRDPTSNVKRLAEFIGYPFSIEEEKCGVVENIINLCSFQNMSNLEVNKTGKFREFTENKIYFRKGEDGDWKNYFTNEMKEKIDKLIDEKLGHTGLVLK